MNIPAWVNYENQECTLGKHRWSVARIVELSRNLPVFEINVDALYMYYIYEKLTLREMVMHMKAVNDASLDFPIILDEDGELLDGRHRIMKALLNGEKIIKAVRFSENPRPCSVQE